MTGAVNRGHRAIPAPMTGSDYYPPMPYFKKRQLSSHVSYALISRVGLTRRSSVTQIAFQAITSNPRASYRTLPRCRTIFTSTPLVSGPKLTKEMLFDVINDKALACRVNNFIPQKDCDLLTSRLMGKLPYEYYTYAQGSVGRIGFSFSETGTAEDRDRYYAEAQPSINAVRETCDDIRSPIDQFRLALQDCWIYGANFEMMDDGKKMFVGLCRMIEANKNILPHQDMIHWYDRFSPASLKILKQLTMNIYLKVPEKGGETELWDWGFNDQEEYEKLAAGSYGIDKSKLPPPTYIIKPELGDLIIFNPGKLHCISTGSGQRFSVSCFIGFHGEKKPLTWWS